MSTCLNFLLINNKMTSKCKQEYKRYTDVFLENTVIIVSSESEDNLMLSARKPIQLHGCFLDFDK